jgi:N-acetyl-anhydromuramyl-L-alanine amidase AmpD
MPLEFQIDDFPFVPAMYSREFAGTRKIRLIVIHSMEFEEKGDTAESCAKYFQNPCDEHGTPRPSAAHLCIDNNSIVRCVPDNNIAGGAPGANADGIQLELAGFARQTEEEWLDDYGKQLLENAANAAAQYCLKYDIPVRQLTNDQLADGQSKGFTSHAQVSEVFKQSDHWDPGPGFPWKFFLETVERHRAARLATLSAVRSDHPDAAGAVPGTNPETHGPMMTSGSNT